MWLAVTFSGDDPATILGLFSTKERLSLHIRLRIHRHGEALSNIVLFVHNIDVFTIVFGAGIRIGVE
jgi:hypothetical protein